MPFKYYGGVHPDEMKQPHLAVSTIPQPSQVAIPLQMHIGAPCQPLVKVGDVVTMGQKIGDNPAPLCAPIHATVSGKVVAIEPRRHCVVGDLVPTIVIENDGLDTPCTDLAPLTEEQLKDPEAIIQRIREAGVVGMGGAMFPTHFKIQGGRGKVDTLIINGAECEPYLNGDHRTMLEHPVELLKGIELVRIAQGVDTAYYGIEENKQDAIDLLNSLNPEQYGIVIVPEKVKYPQGAEKMQVKANTNREVKPGGIPSGVGCNVVSTFTAYSVYRACYEGRPLIERVLSVGGSAIQPANVMIRFGTPIQHVIDNLGGFIRPIDRIVLGGPMMGFASFDQSCGLIKGISGLLCFTEDENRDVENPTCIRCGKCIEVCPMKLQPIHMYMYTQKKDYDAMQKFHVMDCFECGSCTYNCPGRLPLTPTFKMGKAMLKANDAKMRAKAEAAQNK